MFTINKILNDCKMTDSLQTINARLEGLNRIKILILAAITLLAVGTVDYLTGYEVSLSVFYLAPVAIASWYAECQSGIAWHSSPA